jgi:hypothetical protein
MSAEGQPTVAIPCPECGQPTDSLKKYGYVTSWWAVLALVFFRREDRVACPACIRQCLWRRSLFIVPTNLALSIGLLLVVKAQITPLNVILANLWILCVFLPWTVALAIASFRKGHSKGVNQGSQASAQ